MDATNAKGGESADAIAALADEASEQRRSGGGAGRNREDAERRERTFAATVAWTFARCSSLPLKTGVVYPGTFLRRWTTSACCPGTWRWPVASESAWAEFLLGGVDMVESGMVYESVAH